MKLFYIHLHACYVLKEVNLGRGTEERRTGTPNEGKK